MTAFYNEIDPYAAQWLRNLIAAGHIAPGVVDERSIVDLKGSDLDGYTQVHLFAGIGGWSLAARLAGWGDDEPLWTGSCPCQPYSAAGKGLGDADPRNLWPHMYRLIRECRPDVVAGEQVPSAIGHGWLDGVSTDLEAEGYAVGSIVLGAHSVGAPHVRQRLWWLADTGCEDGQRRSTDRSEGPCDPESAGQSRAAGVHSAPSGLGDAHSAGSLPGEQASEATGLGRASLTDGGLGGVVDSDRAGCGEHSGAIAVGTELVALERAGRGGWDDYRWIPCADGKARRIESGLEPLAHGIPNRVGRLRAYGNAIVPQEAAVFLRAYRSLRAS